MSKMLSISMNDKKTTDQKEGKEVEKEYNL